MSTEENGIDEIFDDYHSKIGTNIPEECDLCVLADQRIFYLHHRTKKSYWEPPCVSWNCHLGLPYGWEEAVDAFGTQYFINHLTKTTTYEDPRQGASVSTATVMDNNESNILEDMDFSETPPLRTYEIHRHPTIGFGFVAASQHPVIIQFVTLGGPSDGKLLANDQIIEVNRIDVSKKDKDAVVKMIRGSESPLVLTVSQIPYKKKTGKKSNFRVRFEDKIVISDNDMNDHLPLIPNVVRVFLENGQTKSFKYDQNTCVQDVLNSLIEKLQVKNGNKFALTSEQYICTRSPKLNLLRSDQLLSELATHPVAQSSRVRFRLTFVPQDIRQFAVDDINAFNYLYEQCVNDVVAGRYSYEMRYEACIRLAALHLRQVAIDTNSLKPDGRASVSKMEKEYGLATFLPTILLENVKKKEIRKHLRFYLKKDDEEQPQKHCGKSPRNCTPIKKCSTSEELPSFSVCSLIGDTYDIGHSLRLKYVQMISNLPSFGGRSFSVTFKQTHVDMIMQVDPIQGLLVRHPGKLSKPTISIDYDLIDYLIISPDSDILQCITIRLRNTTQQGVAFLIDKDDINDLVLYVKGYCQVIYDRNLNVEYSDEPIEFSINHSAPSYEGTHFVYPAGWNYSNEIKPGFEVMANFSHGPPLYNQAIGATALLEEITTSETATTTESKSISSNTCNEQKDDEIKKSNLDLPKFIDDLPSINSPDSPSRRSRLLTMTESLLSKNRCLSPRFRDSIRIYKQRHSFPNASPLSSPRLRRRLSSSSDTDCSQSSLVNRAEILTKISTQNSSENLFPRPTCIKRNSLTPTRNFNQNIKSFGLNSPDQLPQKVQINHTINSDKFDQKYVESVLSLFPDKVCTDLEIIDLTNDFASDEERKQVRFNFVENQPPPKPPRRTLSLLNKVNKEEEFTNLSDKNGISHALVLNNNTESEISIFKNSGINCHFPTSKTFPMTTNDMDFNDDFVPRTYTAARQDWKSKESQIKPQVRRMSLKEFTGLEQSNSKLARSSMSPILARFHRTSLSTSNGSHLLDKFCIRRRSSSGIHRGPLSDIPNIDHVVTNRFTARSPSCGAPRLVYEAVDFNELEKRISQMRTRLTKIMENIPNESPRKRNTVESEKSKMMEELSRLASTCKNMVRVTTLSNQIEEQWKGIILDSVDCAESVVNVSESILKKSNSLYQAQLMTSKIDQMLRALIETLFDIQKAYGAKQYGEEAKQLVRSSTTLAATLNQLIHSLQSL